MKLEVKGNYLLQNNQKSKNLKNKSQPNNKQPKKKVGQKLRCIILKVLLQLSEWEPIILMKMC
jgi:hypothetical protein